MKMHVEIDMTPEEARKVMGLPDVSQLQDKMLVEMERRMKAAMDTSDPEAMLRALMPMGGQAFEQVQKLVWEGARRSGGSGKKDAK
jgi:hypothetical protein